MTPSIFSRISTLVSPTGCRTALILSLVLTSGCSTFGGRSETDDNLYKVQKRLLELERKINDEVLGKQKQEGAKRLAQGEEKLDQISNELNIVRGELDALRIGVTMGEMPGTPQDHPTIAKSVQELAGRIHAIEARQLEIIELMDKTKGKSAAKPKEQNLKSLAQVQKAYDDKKYQAIVQSSEGMLASNGLKGEERGQLKFYYAQSLFGLNKFRDAAIEYNQLLGVGGLEAHYPEIKLHLGDCFRKLGDNKAALIFYRELQRDFPRSKEAEFAKVQVKQLGSK